MHTELGSWRRAWRRVGKAEVEVEVDADMVEEARRRRRRRRRATTLIKSNNPHLAGGEKSKANVPHVIYMRKNMSRDIKYGWMDG